MPSPLHFLSYIIVGKFTMQMFQCCRLLSVLILAVPYDCIVANVVVQTSSGKLRGLNKIIDGEELFKFVGIPYARPPTGALRWRKPEKVEPWDGAKDATTYGPSCMQSFNVVDVRHLLPNKEISEDCLTLQVHVPRVLQSGPTRSVMFWIYGGAFNWGFHLPHLIQSYILVF